MYKSCLLSHPCAFSIKEITFGQSENLVKQKNSGRMMLVTKIENKNIVCHIKILLNGETLAEFSISANLDIRFFKSIDKGKRYEGR